MSQDAEDFVSKALNILNTHGLPEQSMLRYSRMGKASFLKFLNIDLSKAHLDDKVNTLRTYLNAAEPEQTILDVLSKNALKVVNVLKGN